MATGPNDLLCQYRLKPVSFGDEWTTHTLVASDSRNGAKAWREQVVPVLRRRYKGGVETRVVTIEQADAEATC